MHEYLAKDSIDRIIDIKTDLDVKGAYYLHAPVWFITYVYKNAHYYVLMDGASAKVIKGDLPSEDFKLI